MSNMIARMDDQCEGFCAICEIYVSGRIIDGSANTKSQNKPISRMNSIVQGACGHTGTLTTTAKNKVNSLSIGKINDTFSGVYSGYVVVGDERAFTK